MSYWWKNGKNEGTCHFIEPPLRGEFFIPSIKYFIPGKKSFSFLGDFYYGSGEWISQEKNQDINFKNLLSNNSVFIEMLSITITILVELTIYWSQCFFSTLWKCWKTKNLNKKGNRMAFIICSNLWQLVLKLILDSRWLEKSPFYRMNIIN